LEEIVNDYSIKKKLILFYLCCVLLPLFITDSVILGIIYSGEVSDKRDEIEGIASAVEAELDYNLEEAAKMANAIYLSRYINEFLDQRFDSGVDFFEASLDIEKKNFYEISGSSSSAIYITMYSDNETIVNGNHFYKMSAAKNEKWYQGLRDSDANMKLFFYYIGEENPSANILRKISLVRKMDYYKDLKCEKLVRVDLDYSNFVRQLSGMQYNMPVYLCLGDMIIWSNEGDSGTRTDFSYLTGEEKIGYTKEYNKYGEDIRILVMETESDLISIIKEHMPLIFLMLTVNILFPGVLVVAFNRSIVSRITELSNAFNQMEGDSLKELNNVRGSDEIGMLMRNYNRMVYRFRELIQTVYKDQLEKQKMDIARQNAELLALHSQINPHFLFNVLEGIRMHSVLKGEEETAKMVERLALLERETANWKNDTVLIREEVRFIEAYLELQKHRFGERLKYRLDIEEDCLDYYIPKLTLVTFVENACVHGVERKSTTCWVYVRVYKKRDKVYLEVEDTGAGMEEDKVDMIREKMQTSNIETLRTNKHIGIANACLRLKMVTNQTVEFELDSEPGAGTFILIKVPVDNLQVGGEKVHD